MPPTPHRLATLIAALFAAAAFGQSAPPATPPLRQPGVVELSPFVIDASQESGWVATQTLAGSRMKTDFKDLAQPIEVLTKDFMEDLGLNNFEQATYYTTNVEGPNEHANNASDGGAGFGTSQPKNNNIFRGLTSGTSSHDFFETDMPADNYNTERITVARGPNSILFGLGSPGGVFDATFKRGNLRLNSAQVQFQATSDSSTRATFDVNRVVLKDRLAVRVAGMTDEGIAHIKPSFDHQNRLYGVVTAKPLKQTTVSVTYERANWNSNRPLTVLPVDNYSVWLNANSIPGTPYTAGSQLFDNRVTGATNPGNFTVANLGTNPIFVRAGNPAVMLFGAGALDRNFQSWTNSVTIRQAQTIPDPFNTLNSFDRFSFSANKNNPVPYETNLDGSDSELLMKSDNWNVFLEQRIGKNLFIEAAWNHQSYFEQTANAGFIGTTIQVDANRFLPDGTTVNPNAGRYYIQGRATGTQFEQLRDDYRATASYHLDLRRFGGRLGEWLLGHSNLMGLISQNNYRRRGTQYQRGILENNPALTGIVLPTGSLGTPTGTGTSLWASTGQRDFTTRFYLGSAAGNSASNPFGKLSDNWFFKDNNGAQFGAYLFSSPYKNAQGWDLVRTGSGPEMTQTKADTTTFAWQDYLLKDRLVLLFGYRKDKAKSASVDPIYQVRDFSGLYPNWMVAKAGPWGVAQAGITRTFGAVVHVTRWASINYSRSNTFQPNIGKFDPFGNEYPGAVGEATDYGVSVRFFDDKLVLKLSHFENTAGPTRGGNTGYNDPLRDQLYNIDNQMQILDPSLPTINVGSGGYRDKGRANYWVMLSNHSEGYELEASWRVNKNLTFIVNGAKNQAIQSDIATEWFQWTALRLPVWQKLNVPEGGKSNPRDVNGDGVIGTWTWANAPYTGNNGAKTFQQYYEQDIVSQSFAFIQAVDGLAVDQGRALRSNFIGQYQFNEGRLKGLAFNFAAHYRGPAVLSYRTKVTSGGTLTFDIDRPIKGPDTILTDGGIIYNNRLKWFNREQGGLKYRAQLNVRNLLNSYTLLPVRALTTGQYVRFQRTNPRTYVATVTFDF